MPPSPGAAVAVPSNLAVVDLAPRVASLRDEVVAGLSKPRKALPPKLFYDALGSELFAAICRTSAYYLTRTETAILAQHAEEIAVALGHGCSVLEPGAGEARKIRLLLPALRPRLYAGYDISREPLVSAAEELAVEVPVAGRARRACRLPGLGHRCVGASPSEPACRVLSRLEHRQLLQS